MGTRFNIGAGFLALAIAGSAPAAAQPVYVSPDGAPPPGYQPLPGLAPGHVLAIVRSAGLAPLTQPARRGPRYVLLAADRYGQPMRVVVDAHGGRILRIAPAHDPRFAGPALRPPGAVPLRPHAGPPPRELKDPRDDAVGGPPATPPRGAIQNPRVAVAPPVTGAMPAPTARQAEPRPARTPLPRPRPALAASAATPEVAAPPPPPAAETIAPAETAPAKPAPTPAAKEPAKPDGPALVPVAPLE